MSINLFLKTYIVLTLAITLIGRVIPVKGFVGTWLEAKLYILLALVGLLFVFVDLFHKRYCLKSNWCWLLYIFIATILLTTILNRELGILNNLKTIVWTIIQFALIYPFYTRYSSDELVDFLKKIWLGMATLWIIPIGYAIYQYFSLQGCYYSDVTSYVLRQGFCEHRLFGVFNDPNYAAITSLQVVIACIYLYSELKCIFLRIFFVLNSLLQIVYVVLSGSRAALVIATTVLFIFLIFKFYSYIRNRKLIQKIILYISLFCVAICIVSGLSWGGQLLSTSISSEIASANTKFIIEEKQDGFNADSLTLEREDVRADNLSNNRLTIWYSYLQGLKSDVFLGGSPRNVLEKWQMKNPNGYLALTNYETHNGYLYLLVGTGICGLSLCLLFFYLLLDRIIRFSLAKARYNKDLLFVLSIMLTILIMTFFFTELFFIHSLNAVLFWLHCGILQKVINDCYQN